MERGFLWPAHDHDCAAVVFDMAADLDAVYGHCRSFAVAVQAGGNCGVWPAAIGRRFEIVYTFEPDPMNFRCLCANAPAENVVKFNAALGAVHGMLEMDRQAGNCGAHSVSDGPRGGCIPTMRVDDLALEVCDLIYLDVEGYELRALQGASSTIDKCRPTIAVEDKGLSERYGSARGEIERWLESNFNYRVVARPHRDVVLVPIP